LLWLFWRWGLTNYLSRLISNLILQISAFQVAWIIGVSELLAFGSLSFPSLLSPLPLSHCLSLFLGRMKFPSPSGPTSALPCPCMFVWQLLVVTWLLAPMSSPGPPPTTVAVLLWWLLALSCSLKMFAFVYCLSLAVSSHELPCPLWVSPRCRVHLAQLGSQEKIGRIK
jgi:hypothetical protein